MKIEKINEDKIKVTLSTTELQERNLDFQALRYNTPEAQTLFWDMMKQAENEHGFKTTNCQLFIEAASVNDGQFIVTVTKIQDAPLPPIPQKRKLPIPELKVRKKQEVKSENSIYRFDDFEQICNLLKSVTVPVDLPSTLYEYKNAFFIITKPSKMLHLVISEFGGFTYKVKDHTFQTNKTYGYGKSKTLEIFSRKRNHNKDLQFVEIIK